MSGKRVLQLVLTMGLGAAVLSLSGCGQNDNSVTFKSGGMTHTFSEGANTVTQGCPLPIYPNATASGSVEAKGDASESNVFLMLKSKDDVDKVSQFYASKLPADGWKVQSNSSLPGKLICYSASKGDLEANVMLSKDEDGQTTINLAASHESKDTPQQAPAGETYSPDKLNPPTD